MKIVNVVANLFDYNNFKDIGSKEEQIIKAFPSLKKLIYKRGDNSIKKYLYDKFKITSFDKLKEYNEHFQQIKDEILEEIDIDIKLKSYDLE